MTDATLLAAVFGSALVGIGVAAWILRFELRAQARARRRRGFLIGGER